jgi:formamidopyrimidine-DNA glycosylase
MIELPEAASLARQITETLRGKRVADVIAAASPHKFAWFNGDPGAYRALLVGTVVDGATSHGGFVEVALDGVRVVFAEGVNLRVHGTGEQRPRMHQLLVEFDDGSALSAAVQMYGGLWAFRAGTFENPYLETALSHPSPLSEVFDRAYLDALLDSPQVQTLSLKAALATGQRIPGLGNGVLQDILFEARLHPKRKLRSLADDERRVLFEAVKSTLAEMARLGGRDTERDLLGAPGGYPTRLSRKAAGQPCTRCGTAIVKEIYLGGAVYVRPGCQRA